MTGSALGSPLPFTEFRPTGTTLESAWWAASGSSLHDELLRWPPDVFALTDTLLERTEGYRFVVSPPPGRRWRGLGDPGWSEEIAAAARDWSRRPDGPPPQILATAWSVLRQHATASLEAVASGSAWRVCEALLVLHAAADEACAGVTARSDEETAYHSQARGLLARTGSMARIDPGRMRVLPRYRTPAGGISIRSISRYAVVVGPQVSVNVHQPALRRRPPASGEFNLLLLPWPLSISAGDFRARPESVHRRELEPFGYFDFQPLAPFDLSLVDNLFAAARAHVDRVDLVVLPEGSLSEDDLPGLEQVMSRHGIDMLVAGIRSSSPSADGFVPNWVQIAIASDGTWAHYRQDKHHRWSLDRGQIEQYHLEEALDPEIRWWEAMALPRRTLQIVERPDGHTVASLICEDLAHIDESIDLLRATGPSLIIALLLDGPQLASRWASRYAAILTDDPGSAVLTLSPYGMVRRSSPAGLAPSPTVALWRDRTHGTEEITLAADAQGVLLTTYSSPTLRRAADGRRPEMDVTELSLGGVTQVRAARTVGESNSRSLPAPGPSNVIRTTSDRSV